MSSLPNLTLFSIPKPFKGHIATIQNNALQSWSLLGRACEVILFGDEIGTAEAATRLKFRHVPEVACNEYGTPLVSDLFAKAQTIARTRFISYVNADIILMSDFLEVVGNSVNFPSEFLMVGRRWNVNVREVWDFASADWESDLRSFMMQNGELQGPNSLDCFVFPRGMYPDVPPFAIGRLAWDNWLVYQALAMGVPVVDASAVMTIVHQKHGYAPNTIERVSNGWNRGPEAQRNLALAGKGGGAFGVWDATWVLDQGGLRRRALTPAYLSRRLMAFLIRRRRLRPLFRPVWRMWTWLRGRPLAWFGKQVAIT